MSCLAHTVRRMISSTGFEAYRIITHVAACRAEITSLATRSRSHPSQLYRTLRISARVSEAQSRPGDELADLPSDVDLDHTTQDPATTPEAIAKPDTTSTQDETTPFNSSTSAPKLQSTPTSEPPPPPSNIPWYLSQPAPIPSPTPSSRPLLPTLPSHAPPILPSLLDHLSTSLGLDDLSLLDLRTLDPPSALGANLIMLIATARSDKHLHVSADRLCRWLRTEHRLTPYADGLLGRNEVKLKLRRAARRARLLSAAGAKGMGAAGRRDDGIRSGWVCVNLGTVEGGMLPQQEAEAQQQGIVGFRSEEEGCRVVVQMFTDEKRGELDLESLWAGILRRSGQDDGRDEEAQQRKQLPRPVADSPFPEAELITA